MSARGHLGCDPTESRCCVFHCNAVKNEGHTRLLLSGDETRAYHHQVENAFFHQVETVKTERPVSC